MDHDLVPQFEASVIFDGDVPVVVVKGEVDVVTVDRFREAVDTAITHGTRIEIDLRDTTFMSAAGLSVLIAAYHRLGPAREAIVLRSPPPVLCKVLDIVGVRSLVDVREGDVPHTARER